MRTTIHLPDLTHDLLKLLDYRRRSTMSELLREAVELTFASDLEKERQESEEWCRKRGVTPRWSVKKP